MATYRWIWLFLLGAFWLAGMGSAVAALPQTVARIKSSILAVGTYQRTRTPSAVFRGTGFVVADGRHVLTNAHVLPETVDREHSEVLAVFFKSHGKDRLRGAKVVDMDKTYDIAVLKIAGDPLPALSLGDSDTVREGENYAFTGYPIGMVLGLYPVTHRGIVASITPIAIPALRAGQLNPKLLRRLNRPYRVFQLDATAYPGNSGSPLYDPKTGTVIGIINKVFVKESKENLLAKPSGISYAVPIEYAKQLLRENDVPGY
ncbi:MAG: trypsin-like peptidase domain-containing protein [Methylothermaceae bacterium]|nr:trypsin-like peptidase domain-containing protein [Methylothermaceae bacterium]